MKPQSWSTKLASHKKKWQEFESKLRYHRPTYVYGEALGVLQIAEYFIGRESDAFIHGPAAGAPVKADAFRHSRYCYTQRA